MRVERENGQFNLRSSRSPGSLFDTCCRHKMIICHWSSAASRFPSYNPACCDAETYHKPVRRSTLYQRPFTWHAFYCRQFVRRMRNCNRCLMIMTSIWLGKNEWSDVISWSCSTSSTSAGFNESTLAPGSCRMFWNVSFSFGDDRSCERWLDLPSSIPSGCFCSYEMVGVLEIMTRISAAMQQIDDTYRLGWVIRVIRCEMHHLMIYYVWLFRVKSRRFIRVKALRLSLHLGNVQVSGAPLKNSLCSVARCQLLSPHDSGLFRPHFLLHVTPPPHFQRIPFLFLSLFLFFPPSFYLSLSLFLSLSLSFYLSLSLSFSSLSLSLSPPPFSISLCLHQITFNMFFGSLQVNCSLIKLINQAVVSLLCYWSGADLFHWLRQLLSLQLKCWVTRKTSSKNSISKRNQVECSRCWSSAEISAAIRTVSSGRNTTRASANVLKHLQLINKNGSPLVAVEWL